MSARLGESGRTGTKTETSGHAEVPIGNPVFLSFRFHWVKTRDLSKKASITTEQGTNRKCWTNLQFKHINQLSSHKRCVKNTTWCRVKTAASFPNHQVVPVIHYTMGGIAINVEGPVSHEFNRDLWGWVDLGCISCGQWQFSGPSEIWSGKLRRLFWVKWDEYEDDCVFSMQWRHVIHLS